MVQRTKDAARGRAGAANRGMRLILADGREVDNCYGVCQRDFGPIDAAEKMEDLIERAELGILLTDVPRREVGKELNICAVNDRREQLLPLSKLLTDRNPDELPRLVFV